MRTKLITPLERIAVSDYCCQINHAPVPGRGFLRLTKIHCINKDSTLKALQK